MSFHKIVCGGAKIVYGDGLREFTVSVADGGHTATRDIASAIGYLGYRLLPEHKTEAFYAETGRSETLVFYCDLNAVDTPGMVSVTWRLNDRDNLDYVREALFQALMLVNVGSRSR